AAVGQMPGRHPPDRQVVVENHRQPEAVLDAVVEAHGWDARPDDARVVVAGDDAVAVPLPDPARQRRSELALLEEDRPWAVLAEPPRDAAQDAAAVLDRRLDDERDVGPGPAPSRSHVKKREERAPVRE